MTKLPIQLTINGTIAQYEVEPAQCEKDLISLLSELADQDLIEIHDQSAD